MEECLLQWSGGHDAAALAVLTRSWACGLVHIVADKAIDLQHPVVLASEAAGNAWLVIASLGRCLLGWPLEILDQPAGEAGFFVPIVPLTLSDMKRLIITNPYIMDEYAQVPVAVDMSSGRVTFCRQK